MRIRKELLFRNAKNPSKITEKKVKRLLFAGGNTCKGLIAGKLGTKKLTRGKKPTEAELSGNV